MKGGLGCHTPLDGLVGRPDGTLVLRGAITGPATDAVALGKRLAEQLIARDADVIVRDSGTRS